MTRRTAVATAGATAGLAIAACGVATKGGAPEAASSGVPSRPVSLVFLDMGTSAPGLLFTRSLETFRERHPQVNVEHLPRTTSVGNVMQNYLALASAGTPPDMMSLNPPYVEPLRARGQLADLTPYVRRDAKTFQPEDFSEAALLRTTRGGKWHAVPQNNGLWFLIYNTDAFKRVGAGAPDASWTWDQLRDAVRTKIKPADPNVLGMTYPPYELPIRCNGGDILSKDEKRCLLDEPAAYEAIQWIADLMLKHQVAPTADDMAGLTDRQLFDTGRIVAHVSDPGFLSNTQRNKLNFSWDIATLPKGKAARVSTVKGPSIALSAEGKEKDTAWAWTAHYCGPEMQRVNAVEGKIVSARKSALKAFVELDEGYNKKALLDVAAISRPMPYVARYDEMDQIISTGRQAVYRGEQAAKTAMAEVARKVNEILATIPT